MMFVNWTELCLCAKSGSLRSRNLLHWGFTHQRHVIDMPISQRIGARSKALQGRSAGHGSRGGMAAEAAGGTVLRRPPAKLSF